MGTLTKELIFPVTGMSCAACAASVESMIGAQKGVQAATVNYGSASVKVLYSPEIISSQELRTAVQSVGYDLIITENKEEAKQLTEASKKSAYAQLKRQTIGAITLALPIIIIAMFLPGLPWANEIMMVLTLPVVAWFGKDFFLRAMKQLRHRMMSMDTLVALSTGIAFLFSLFNTVYPDYWTRSGLAAHVYYEAAAAIISFVLLGKLLEARAKAKTGKALKQLLGLQPTTVTVLTDDGSLEHRMINEVTIGTHILVKPGEKLPVDGEVIGGSSYVDESMITGEPMPVKKTALSKVFTGTINQQGSLTIQAEKVGEATLLAQIISTVEKAQGSKAPVQFLVDKIAAIFVPIVLAISLLSFIFWMIFGGDHALSYALITSVSVLVIACPCALGLATPTAIIVGMGRGAENNILIKDAESLERIKSIDTIIFDKTGTITYGNPEVQHELWLKEQLNDDLLDVLIAIEEHSEHPLAKAIINRYKQHKHAITLSNFESLSGLGVVAQVDKTTFFVGNAQLLHNRNIAISPEVTEKATAFENEGLSVVFFANSQELLAMLTVGDKIKDNAAEVIQHLHAHGIQTLMLTGDTAGTAAAVAASTGVMNYYAALLPHQKAEIVKTIQGRGHKVAMVGDGINDSEALALADVSIAMGSGSDIAMEVSQITLRSSNLELLPKVIALSQQTGKTINQNLFWAFIYNLIGIPVAAGLLYPMNEFLLNPMLAAAAMAISSVSVVSNSLLLSRRPLKMKPLKNKPVLHKINPIMNIYKFKTTINCNGCIAAVTPKLEALQGIEQWSVDIENPEKILTVTTARVSSSAITKAVKAAGFSIETVE